MNELSILAMQTSKDKTVTTKELAETLDVDVRTIQRVAKKLFDPSTLMSRVINGGKSSIFTEEQATAIKIELQNHSKVAQNGFNTLSISNDLEMMLLQRKLAEYQDKRIVELEEENKKMSQKLIEQSPKVEFYNDVADSDSTINMAEVAKVLNVKGIGRNNLFKFLRENNIFDEKNIPYQRYVNAGFFKLVEYKFICDGKVKVGLKPVVYQKGVDYINKLLRIKKDEIIYE